MCCCAAKVLATSVTDLELLGERNDSAVSAAGRHCTLQRTTRPSLESAFLFSPAADSGWASFSCLSAASA